MEMSLPRKRRSQFREILPVWSAQNGLPRTVCPEQTVCTNTASSGALLSFRNEELITLTWKAAGIPVTAYSGAVPRVGGWSLNICQDISEWLTLSGEGLWDSDPAGLE